MNLDALRSVQSGPVLTPDDHGYDAAVSSWGPPATPDVLVRPASADEVGAVVLWATSEGVEVGVRSGGHGVWDLQPGGVLIDLGALSQVEVTGGGLVQVGGGLTWGAVADRLEPHGLALSSGDVRSVGVGGNATGAGIGWLVRSVGLAVDQLVGAQVVTADGRVVDASEEDNPELFFAIRGGGGNFGVVTRFDFRAEKLDDVVFGTAPIDVGRLAEAIRGVRDAMRDAPRELGVTLVKAPAGPQQEPVLELLWAGVDEEAARAAAAPLLASPGVGTADLKLVPYASTLTEPPPSPPGPQPRRIGSNAVFRELPDSVADRASAALAAHPQSMFEIRFLGGALADVPADATAIAWRDAEALVHWFAMVPPQASDADISAARELWAPVGEGADAVCGTFTDESSPEVVERMYPPATLERLRRAKRTWDPGNVFRRNHNIAPA